MNKIQYGYCHCGCNQKTNIATRNDKRRGHIKGSPVFYISSHTTPQRGENSPKWKGGKSPMGNGYIGQHCPNHPKANRGCHVYEHILVAEKILGKHLPKGAVIHHVNGIRTDNRPENLVICQDQTYHKLLHRREKALKVCGHADWRNCTFCQQWDDPIHMYVHPNNRQAFHRKCHNLYRVNKRKNYNRLRPSF